ncbi:hypothetical protein [Pseudofrankia sp. DC12]|uniref:hypothetical protein n=1 Tax=Pseudofrankia sp. DC12 TaxID=683315 RepID=UPI000B14C637|nr:hypothetical protein [Pseudofrankia sp. DC12]
MPEIRKSSTAGSSGRPRRTDVRSASLNRALAGARAPQVAAAQRVQLHRDVSVAGRRRAAMSALVAARRRTNFLLGTLDGLRRGAGGRRVPGESTG